MRPFKLALYTTVVFLALTLFSPYAHADLLNFDLTTPNSGLSNGGTYTGQFATVTVNRTSSSAATITFQSLTQTISGTDYIYLIGSAQAVDLNVNASSFTVDSVTGSNSGAGFTPAGTLTPSIGLAQVDGFGHFNLTIDDSASFPQSFDQVVVTLTNNDPLGWATASEVLTDFNPSDSKVKYYAADHAIVSYYPASAGGTDYPPSTNVGVTGFASSGSPGTGGPPPTVPEPASLFLIGVTLLGWALLYRRRQKA